MRGRTGHLAALGPTAMRLFARTLLAAGILASAIPPAGAAPADVIADVQELLASPRASGLRFSLEFVPLGPVPPRASVSVAADVPLIPASVTKLVATAAALEVLGPTYTFETRMHRSGPIEDGSLSGDLGISGDGDPFLVTERVWLLAHQLRGAGLRRVEGDLVIHASGFPLDDPTAEQSLGQSDRSYAARPSGVALNFNCVTLRAIPGDRPGAEVRIAGDPYDLGYLEVDNGLRTGAPGSPIDWTVTLESTAHGLRFQDWVGQIQSGAPDSTGPEPSFVLPEAPLEIARLRGALPLGAVEQVAYRRARYPLPQAGWLLRTALADFDITVAGRIRVDIRPPATPAWIVFSSPPVADLLEDMNRYSSNFIANQIALGVHRVRSGSQSGLSSGAMPGASETAVPPGSAGSGSAPGGSLDLPAATFFLDDAGATLSSWLADVLPEPVARGCVLHDGSGLSTENRLTARALTALLVRAWGDLRVQPKLVAALPGPGEPGTLRRRFRNDDAPIWAKTGTLADTRVSALAGYFEDGAGEPVAFSILVNSDDPGWDVSAMQDLQERWIALYRR